MPLVAAALSGANPAVSQTVDATSPTDGAPMTAVLSFVAADGQAVGGGMMTDSGQSITFTAQFSNLPAGRHQLRVHETGRCAAPMFESAGSPINTPQGTATDADAQGLGVDGMPIIEVSDTGVAIARAELERLTLIGEGPGVLLDDDGAAVMVHSMDTDERGARGGAPLACAVVQPD